MTPGTAGDSLAEIAARLLGGELRRARALHGGSLSEIQQIFLIGGREAIVKSGPAPRVEAAMLEAIAASGAPAPAVLAVNDTALVIELLPAGGSLSGAWPSLGRALTTLHGARGERYGWPHDYAFGGVAIANEWADDWSSFWAERRLLVNSPHVPRGIGRRIEALARDLPNRLPQAPAPALLHGDLWGGNVLAEDGCVSGLVDPACYFGHVEVDIAMLTLFDRPPSAFFECYEHLGPGYEARLPIYQLWPALVHLRLFGGGYRPMVEGLLAAAGV